MEPMWARVITAPTVDQNVGKLDQVKETFLIDSATSESILSLIKREREEGRRNGTAEVLR